MKRHLRTVRLVAAAAACWILATLPVFAAEEGGQDPADSVTGWIFRWLNFLAVFGAIGYLIAKNGPAYFGARAEAIAGGIKEAARAKEEAEALLRDAEAKLAGFPQEVQGLRAEARQHSAGEAERIRGLAAQETERIESAAGAEVEAARRAARIELKAAGARLAVERAEAMLRQQINPAAQSKLVRTFVEELARSAS